MKLLVAMLSVLVAVGCDREEARATQRREKYEAQVAEGRQLLESRLRVWKEGKRADELLPMLTDDYDRDKQLRSATLIDYQIPSYLNNSSAGTSWTVELKLRGADGQEFSRLMRYKVVGSTVEAHEVR